MDDFEKKFKEISRVYDPQKIWEEWLDYVIDINLYTTQDQGLDFEGREKDYYELFTIYLKLLPRKVSGSDDNDVNGWYDYLGIFYEENVKTSYKASSRGQFFTPSHICDFMAEVTMGSEDYKNRFLMDSCCGSGRFLLAAHSREPLIIGWGIDLDETSVKMSVINLMFHGARGTIIHGNSLSGEFFKGYKVNQYLGHGLPAPHVQLLNDYEDGFHYIGVSENICKDNESLICVDKPSNDNGSKGSIQSTLI